MDSSRRHQIHPHEHVLQLNRSMADSPDLIALALVTRAGRHPLRSLSHADCSGAAIFALLACAGGQQSLNACRLLKTAAQASESSRDDDRSQQQQHQRHFVDQCRHDPLLGQQTLWTADPGLRAPHQRAIPLNGDQARLSPSGQAAVTRSRTGPGTPLHMATYKVTLINANEGLNRTIECADDQSIAAAADR